MKLTARVASIVVVILVAHRAPASAQSSTDPVSPRRTPIAVHAFSNATGGAFALGSGLSLLLQPGRTLATPGGAVWRGGILFDEPLRDVLRLRDEQPQELARRISDVMLFATMFEAALVDSIIVPLAQDDPDLAWQASFAHALALGLTLSVGEVVKRATGRARPYERECESDPQRPGCSDPDTLHSFYSLHTGMAFTSAGFSCAMHLSRRLYEDPTSDGIACGTSLAMAGTTGLLRVLADRHYLSDVLVGAALGFLVGYLVPLAIVPDRRSHRSEDAPGSDPTWAVAPMLSPSWGEAGASTSTSGGAVGLSAFGAF